MFTTNDQTAQGVLLVFISAIAWSTVGVFIYAISSDVWVIVFWRGIFIIITLWLYIRYKEGDHFLSQLKKMGWPGWSVAMLSASSTITVILAFKFTSIANVALIYSMSPLVVALIAWILIKERSSIRTLSCSIVACVGVVIMVSGSHSEGALMGDILAIFMTITMSIQIVLYRKYPDCPMMASIIVSTCLLMIAGLLFSQPFSINQKDFWLLIALGTMFAIAFITMVEGTRRIPASKSALIGAAETPLAPVWAWVIFAQFPSFETWLGGIVVLTAVLVYLIFETHNKLDSPTANTTDPSSSLKKSR